MALGSVAPVRKAANARGSDHSFADAPATSGIGIMTQSQANDHVPEVPKASKRVLVKVPRYRMRNAD